MKNRKFFAITISLILAVSSLTACDTKSDTPIIGGIVGLDDNQVFEVDELVCTVPEYKLVYMDTANKYKNDFGTKVKPTDKISSEKTLEDFINNQVKEEITVKYTLAAMAGKKGIVLSDDEKTEISSKADEYFMKLTGAEKEYTGATTQDVETLYTNYKLADKIYEQITAAAGEQISDEDARVIKIQYIRMNAGKTKESKIKSTFEEIKGLVKGGYQQFSREAKQYSEDIQFEKIIKKNEATKDFEKQAFNLNKEDISKIIKDGENYYLVYCVNNYLKEETKANKEKLIKNAKDEYFNQQYNAFLEEAEVDFNTSAWENIEMSTDTTNTSLFK